MIEILQMFQVMDCIGMLQIQAVDPYELLAGFLQHLS